MNFQAKEQFEQENTTTTTSHHEVVDWNDDSTNHFDIIDYDVADNSIDNKNNGIISRGQQRREEIVKQEASCTTTTTPENPKRRRDKSFFSSSIDIKMDESRYSKIKSRVLYGLYMFLTFSLSVYVGHAYIYVY